MKQPEYLFDENISIVVKDYFQRKGFNCEAVKELMKGETDSRIGRYALENNKIIITQGIPIVFSRNGIIYYELPNGEITTRSPFEKSNVKS